MISPNHQKFLGHLDKSEDAVWKIMRLFGDSGYPVWKQTLSRAPEAGQWGEHVDGGDFYIGQRIEVKHLSAQFTGRDDWPFGNKFIVCAKHSWDNAVPKPFGYLMLSKCGEHVAYVKGGTSSDWYVEKRTDKRYDSVSQDFYFCPIDLVYWSRIDA